MSDRQEHKIEPQQWVERYGDYFFSYAIEQVNDSGKAEDLVQATFLAGLKAKERFRGHWLVGKGGLYPYGGH